MTQSFRRSAKPGGPASLLNHRSVLLLVDTLAGSIFLLSIPGVLMWR